MDHNNNNFKIEEKEELVNKIKKHPIGVLKISMNNAIELKNSKILIGGVEIKPNFKKLNKIEKLQQAIYNYKGLNTYASTATHSYTLVLQK